MWNWLDDVDRKCESPFSLRDLRHAKGYTKQQISKKLKISESLYHSIECGHRRPNIDITFRLAVIYGTSMDFIYHAYHRQNYIWNYPDEDLRKALFKALKKDAPHLRKKKGSKSNGTNKNNKKTITQ